MADSKKPGSATKVSLSDSQAKQLKIALKESANKYDEMLEHITEFQREEDRKKKGEIEEVITKELKSTHALCLKLQREIETIEHKSRTASKSADASKKNVSAFAADFRLTPEEQDIAYEFKAHVMQKIHSQNQNIKKELELHEKKVDLKKCQQAYKKQVEDQQKSQTTLVNLMNMYEQKAIKAEKEVKKLQENLKQAEELIDRYDHMHYKQGGDPNKMRKNLSSAGKRTKPEDAVRKNEILIAENGNLKKEISRIKTDNADLIKIAKRVEAERDEAMHSLGTCDIAKQELQKRYEKERKQHKALQTSITNQTANWIQDKKEIRMMEEKERKDQVVPMSPLAAQERTFHAPVKKNTDKPRQMLPVK